MMQWIDRMGGIRAFGIISICLFVAVFAAAMALAFCVKKQFLDDMSALPLDDDSSRNNQPKNSAL